MLKWLRKVWSVEKARSCVNVFATSRADGDLTSSPVIFLKQSAPSHTYFSELAEDVAIRLKAGTLYTGSNLDDVDSALKVIVGPEYRPRGIFFRLWSWMRYLIGAWCVVWSLPSSALLFIVAQPPFLPLLGYFRNKWFGQGYVVWVDDIYPDVLVRYGQFADGHPIIRAWQWLNRLMLSRAERVFTLGPCMAQVLGQYVADASRQITVIPTWVDPETIQPLPKEANPFARQYGQIGKLTVQYSGNLGLTHDLDTMIRAAERLQAYADVHFMIIGSGSGWNDVARSAEQLTNTTVLPLQPAEVVPYSLSTADVAVVALKKGIEGISMPSKAYHAMAAGAALLGISHSPSDVQLVIERHACGINIEPGDVEGFVRAVLRFRTDSQYLAECRQNARHAAEAEYSRAVNVQRVFGLISPFLSQ
jgi:glycosyltransferase involved in cell wall biosynthesis